MQLKFRDILNFFFFLFINLINFMIQLKFDFDVGGWYLVGRYNVSTYVTSLSGMVARDVYVV